MPVTTKVFDGIIDDLIDGLSLRRILNDRRIAPRAFHAALLRDPKLARDLRSIVDELARRKSRRAAA